MSKGRFLRGFEQDLMGNKLSMEFIEGNRIRSEIEGRDDAMKVTTDVAVDNGIEFCGGKLTACKTEFIRESFCSVKVIRNRKIIFFSSWSSMCN